MRWRIVRRIVANLNTAQAASTSRCASRARRAYDAAELDGIVPADLTKQYDMREVIAPPGRRLASSTSSRRTTARRWSPALPASAGMPVGILANNGILFSEIGAEGRAFHRAVLPARASRCCSCRTSPASWWAAQYEAGGIAKDGAKMVTAVACAQVPKITVDHRRLLRRRQLRHVRPRLRAALPVHVAQRAHLGDGRRAGGERAGDVRRDNIEAEGKAVEGRGGGGLQGADPSTVRARGPPLLRHRAAVGRRHHRPGRDAPGAGAGLSGGAQRADRKTRFGVFRM